MTIAATAPTSVRKNPARSGLWILGALALVGLGLLILVLEDLGEGWAVSLYVAAVLADEMGIVMSTSHHEPMMRADKEWNRYGEYQNKILNSGLARQ